MAKSFIPKKVSWHFTWQTKIGRVMHKVKHPIRRNIEGTFGTLLEWIGANSCLDNE